MDKMALFSLIMVVSAFISSVSQVMLKKSAQKTYSSRIGEYLNPLVIIAYSMFVGCTLLSMYALKVVPLLLAPVLESTGYIFVAVLSYIFFKEKLTKRQTAGMALILIGIAVGAFVG
jgi:multidrug transporter EmrE-like cation transporter